MKKILSLILGLVLACGLRAQVANSGHSADVGSVNAQPVVPGDVVGPASSTNNAFARFSGTTGKLLQDSPDLTYSSPTMSVPDAFVVSSAGSIGLTAGGINKNVTITPSGTGNALITYGLAAQPYTYQGFQVVGAVNQRTGFMLDAQGTNNPTFLGRRARDSAGSPSAVQAGDTLVQYSGRGYGATLYPAAQGGFSVIAIDNFTDTVAGQKFALVGVLKGNDNGGYADEFNGCFGSGIWQHVHKLC